MLRDGDWKYVDYTIADQQTFANFSRFNQAVASGIYLYSVEEIPSGRRQVGKFVIVKSDLEE